MWNPDHSSPCIRIGGWNSAGCNVCYLPSYTIRTLTHQFAGMNGTRAWMMAWTSMTSTQAGGIPRSGRAGGSTQGCALGQVRHISIHLYAHLMWIPDDEQTAVKDRSKTIKTPFHIVTDNKGNPEIPSITTSYHSKVVQTTIRKYLTAHISELHPHYILNRFTYT